MDNRCNNTGQQASRTRQPLNYIDKQRAKVVSIVCIYIVTKNKKEKYNEN